MACPNFIPGKCLCAYLLEKFNGKEDLAKKGNRPYNPNDCSFEANANYSKCPQYLEQQKKIGK